MNDSTGAWDIDQSQFPREGGLSEQIRFLLQYAILAPSSHNTQPWSFVINDERVVVNADPSRWLNVADADKRELYISIGCALENLLVASEHFGLGYAIEYFASQENELHVASVTFTADRTEPPFRPAELFEAITVRHTNHKSYESRPIPAEIIERLQSLCVGEGLHVHLTDDPEIRGQVDELVVRGDAIEFARVLGGLPELWNLAEYNVTLELLVVDSSALVMDRREGEAGMVKTHFSAKKTVSGQAWAMASA